MSVLEEAEYECLSGYHTEEHGERIDCRIGNGRCVRTCRVVSVGKCWRIGAATRNKTHDGEEIDFVDSSCDTSDHKKGYESDYESPDDPPHTCGVEHGVGESTA